MKQSHYLIRLGDAISQFLNVLIFNGDPNYSISGESYRLNKKLRTNVIDSLFWIFEQDHCKKAYEHDVIKARILLSKIDHSRF
jgi:hypothetical protein